MKGRYKYSLAIEVDGISEMLEGKRCYFLSSENRASDLFFDTDCGPVNLNVLLLNRRIILFRWGKSPLRTTGKSLLKRIYFSRGGLKLFIGDSPVTLSLKNDTSFIRSKKYIEKAPLYISAFCLMASLLICFIGGRGTPEIVTARRVAGKISRNISKKTTIIDSVCYSLLDKVLLQSGRPDKESLTKLRKALHLSRRIYETGEEEKNSRIIGRMIGGVSHRLHTMEYTE